MCASVRRALSALALLVLLLWPSRALAGTLVGSYDIPKDADQVACDFLGYDYDTMDSGLRALLHNSTAAGGAGTDSNPNFAEYAAFRDSLSSPAILGDYQWYSSYSGFMFVDQVDKARNDVGGAERWWDEYGTDDQPSGGGGTGVEIAKTMVLNPVTGVYYTNANDYSNCVPVGNVTATVKFAISAYNQLQSLMQTYPYCLVVISKTHLAGNPDVGVYLSTSPISTSYSVTGTFNYGTGTYNKMSVSYNSSSSVYYTTYSRTISTNTFSAVTIQISSLSLGNVNSNASANRVGYWTSEAPGGGTEPQPPVGGPIPDPPSNVTNIQEGPTYNTTNNIDIDGTITNTTTNEVAYEIDLSPITDRLDVINDNLVDFAEDMHASWEWLADVLSSMVDDFASFSNTLWTWLQMIYNQIGHGGQSVPDPVESPSGWWDWLGDLVDNVLGDLPAALGAMTTAFSGVRTLFPFSIPWDLGVLLGLFVAQPVTPVVNVPFPYSVNGVAYVRVDCTPYDGVMAAVRSVELVMFAAGLAFKTRDMLRNVEV